MYIRARTVDDLLHTVLKQLLNSKNRIRPSRGPATESIAALLQITNPRARLSLSETKGKLTSCLGELLWYLAGSKSLRFITYYLSRYKEESEDGRTIYGAYGPRLFALRGRDQITNILKLLRKKRDSRRAVIQLFDAADLEKPHREIPCTCTFQFMIRRRRLHMLTCMRSNDAFIGLPHDIFAFTMLQEILARALRVGLGTYNHTVGSLHLYAKHRKNARQYLKEGWQSTAAMPGMPINDPWPSIRKVLRAESAIRAGRKVNLRKLRLHSYWADLVRILQIYACFKKQELRGIEQIKRQMSNRVYDFYINDLLAKLRVDNRTTSTI